MPKARLRVYLSNPQVDRFVIIAYEDEVEVGPGNTIKTTTRLLGPSHVYLK